MSRKQVPAEGWMRPAAIVPQGDSDPLWDDVHAGSYAASHRHKELKTGMKVKKGGAA